MFLPGSKSQIERLHKLLFLPACSDVYGTHHKPWSEYFEQQKEAIAFWKSYGSKAYKIKDGYYRKDLHVVAMFCCQISFITKMAAGKLKNQQAKLVWNCKITNIHPQQQMPLA